MTDDLTRRRRFARSESIVPDGFAAGTAVRDIMSSRVLAVSPATTGDVAMEVASERHVEHLMVSRGSELVGVLCTCDLWEAAKAPVASVMSSPPVTVEANTPIDEAARLLHTSGVGCLPVIDADRVVGVVTRGDLARRGLIDLTEQTCASCGSHHHVRRMAGYASAFCALCLDKAGSTISYDELGWGD